MSTHDDYLEGSESLTFRIQADRRKTDALVNCTNERRATSPPFVSSSEGADPADGSVHPAWFETIAGGSSEH